MIICLKVWWHIGMSSASGSDGHGFKPVQRLRSVDNNVSRQRLNIDWIRNETNDSILCLCMLIAENHGRSNISNIVLGGARR